MYVLYNGKLLEAFAVDRGVKSAAGNQRSC